MDKVDDAELDSAEAIEKVAQSILKMLGKYNIGDDDFELVACNLSNIIQMSIELGVETVSEIEDKKKNRSMRAKLYDAVAFQNYCSVCNVVISTHQTMFCDSYCSDCYTRNIKNRGIKNLDGLQQKQTY